jgi:hypothetical protein
VTLSLDLSLERFPFQLRGKKIEIQQIELFLSLKEGTKPGSTKTYLDSYGDNPLAIAIKSANGTANNKILNSNPSFLNGIPHLSLEDNVVPLEVSSGEKAAWSITVNSETLKQVQDAIIDLWIVCHYSIS